jgi:hypothetical protein
MNRQDETPALTGEPIFPLYRRESDDKCRLRIVWLSDYLVLDTFVAFSRLQEKPGVFCIPKIAGLPDGYEVLRVCYSWERRCFGFMIRHSSFEVVPDGMYAPEHEPLGMRLESVRVAVLPDSRWDEYVKELVLPKPDHVVE